MKIVVQILVACWQRNRAWLAAFFVLWIVALCIPPVRQLLFFDLFGSSLMGYQQAPLSFKESDPWEEFDLKKLPSQDLSTRFATLIQPNYGYGQRSYQDSYVEMPLPEVVVKANNALASPPPGIAPTGPPRGIGGPPGAPPPGPPPSAPPIGVTPVVAPTVVPPKPPTGNPQKEIDNLIQQYPQEAWLVAHRLRQTLSWMQDNQFAGLYEWRPMRPMKIPAHIPEKKPSPPYFTTEQWNQTFALAKHGQQLEPDNAFFDVVLIYLYLAAYRDNDALRVLTSALKKGKYEEHAFKERRIFIRAHEKVRGLLLEEKLNLRTFPWSSNNFDRIATLLAWHAWKWERAGQRIKGLQLRHQIALLAHLIQRSKPREMSYLASAMVHKAYNLHPWQQINQPPAKPRNKWNSYAAQFATVARLLGQNDIARQTDNMAQEAAQRQAEAQNDTTSQGLSERDYYILDGWHEMRLAFLVQMVFMLGASLVLGFFILGSYYAPTPHSQIFASTRWSLVCVVLCAATFFYLTLQQQAVFSSPLYGGINVALGATVVAPIIVAALYAWIGAMKQLRQMRLTHLRKTPGETLLEKRDILSVGASWSFLVTAIAAVICWLIGLYSISKLGTLTVPLLTWNAMPVVISDDPEAMFIIGTFLFGALYICWFLAWRAFTPKTLQPLLHGALRLHRNALAAFALCSVGLYIVSILLSLPYRNAMNVKFENYLHGIAQQK